MNRRRANLIIVLFLAIQGAVLGRALLPLPEPFHGPWPWRMFDRRGPWERTLEATSTTATGRRWQIPLEEIFRYSRGATPLRAYDQLEALDDVRRKDLQAAFARYLARRMEERGVHLETIELAWVRRNLDTGRTRRKEIGRFDVGDPVDPVESGENR